MPVDALVLHRDDGRDTVEVIYALACEDSFARLREIGYHERREHETERIEEVRGKQGSGAQRLTSLA
ncbi:MULTISPECIES: hypothetical protein [Bradyrhizobium]|uniref:hypothetical protein n=1 Tax=Bradyrhizobium TaxID=374 RepID=UPI00041BC607|nr:MULTISPECIES: hypothetical protein [Bradyrhizobium]